MNGKAHGPVTVKLDRKTGWDELVSSTSKMQNPSMHRFVEAQVAVTANVKVIPYKQKAKILNMISIWEENVKRCRVKLLSVLVQSPPAKRITSITGSVHVVRVSPCVGHCTRRPRMKGSKREKFEHQQGHDH